MKHACSNADFSLLTDYELIELVCANDHGAYDVFFRRHFRLIYYVALQIVLDHAEAEDLTQDAFSTLWQKRHEFDSSRGSVISWLTTIVRNRALDRYRQRQRHRELNQQYIAQPNHPQKNETISPDHFLMKSEIFSELRDQLNALPEATNMILRLAYIQGLTQQQIADKIKMPLGTVKARMRRGLLQLSQSRKLSA
jgi:RNA polymerase sigma-70 factor, ECF subfamily